MTTKQTPRVPHPTHLAIGAKGFGTVYPGGDPREKLETAYFLLYHTGDFFTEDDISGATALQKSTPDTVTEQIKAEKNKHDEGVKLLCQRHAAEYNQDVRDIYMSIDETFWKPGTRSEDVSIEAMTKEIIYNHKFVQERIPEVHSTPRTWHLFNNSPTWINQFSALTYTYLETLQALYFKRQYLELQSEFFPQTPSAFMALRSGLAKEKIAEFLVSGPEFRSATIKEYEWDPQQTLKLISAYTTDPAFVLQVADIANKAQQARIVKDPRKRN